PDSPTRRSSPPPYTPFPYTTLFRSEEHIAALTTLLGAVPGVISIEPAGSYRRRKETIGDLDLLAETTDPATLMDRSSRRGGRDRDRKSTRLNSSHRTSSYAVFCLKK